jgi:hypothetical protein
MATETENAEKSLKSLREKFFGQYTSPDYGMHLRVCPVLQTGIKIRKFYHGTKCWLS